MTIEGHTDAKGADAYNQTLSEQRAASVKQWLVANAQVNGAAIATRGWGKSKPVTHNAKPDGSDDPDRTREKPPSPDHRAQGRVTSASRLDRAASMAGAVPASAARARSCEPRSTSDLSCSRPLAIRWRLLADAVHGARVLWLRHRARKTPERAGEFELIKKQLRDAKAARWAAWRAVPLRRRFAVQTAVVAILVAVVITARARYQTSEQPEIDAAATDAALAVPGSDVAPGAPAPVPTVDLDAAADALPAGCARERARPMDIPDRRSRAGSRSPRRIR